MEPFRKTAGAAGLRYALKPHFVMLSLLKFNKTLVYPVNASLFSLHTWPGILPLKGG